MIMSASDQMCKSVWNRICKIRTSIENEKSCYESETPP